MEFCIKILGTSPGLVPSILLLNSILKDFEPMSRVTNGTTGFEIMLMCTLAQKELLKVVYSAYFEISKLGTSPGLHPWD